MEPIAYILYLITLVYTVYTDVKDREISLYTLLMFLLTGFVLSLEYYRVVDIAIQWLLNILFIGIQYGCLMLYLELRYKEGKEIFNKWIGIGDLLFFLVIGLHYLLHEYVFIYLGSLIFSGVVFLCFKSKLKTIPLAGFSAVFILLFELYKRC